MRKLVSDDGRNAVIQCHKCGYKSHVTYSTQSAMYRLLDKPCPSCQQKTLQAYVELHRDALKRVSGGIQLPHRWGDKWK